ncbi:hypothetical protein Poli38472_010615 [Pythium oligandrum]|uniref:Uncharacterized protein n=1 Tax=Pythium oligandrum TaxID=41045 RepID=A0A8K1C3L7_PYTOL|nr:hypothetical protein Poli38472_010615 [Pythium oligandrum]|eukprot:TMW55733.1 hypothetical protein Poli38472_010615 [Pythium oligandrum]
MVANASVFFNGDGDLFSELLPAGVTLENKCRYKTGKCTNVRSSKRNGEPHQLCMHHRDKANKIQRKFDRQKRQIARMRKVPGGRPRSGSNSPRSVGSSAFPGSTASLIEGRTASFASLSTHDVEFYSDSDSSRFSTDSESSVVLDQVWDDLPASTHEMLGLTAEPVSSSSSMGLPTGVQVNPSPHSGASSELSSDEIDFLYAAMLE